MTCRYISLNVVVVWASCRQQQQHQQQQQQQQQQQHALSREHVRVGGRSTRTVAGSVSVAGCFSSLANQSG